MDDDSLRRFLQRDLCYPVAREVLEHVQKCEDCEARLVSLFWEDREPPEIELPAELYKAAAMDAVGRRADELDQQRKFARQRVDQVDESHPDGRQFMFLCAFPTVGGHWTVVEACLEVCSEHRFGDAAGCLRWAELAVKLSAGLSEQVYGTERVNDLRARSLAYKGNALKIAGDHKKAKENLEAARTYLGAGTGDRREHARVTNFMADVYCAEEDFEEALALFNQARKLYADLGDRHSTGCMLAQMGMVLGYKRELHASIPVLHKALELIDPEDLAWVNAARQNLALVLHWAGRNDEAIEILQEIQPYYHETGEVLAQNRVTWLAAKIYRDLAGEDASGYAFTRAELLFKMARDQFLEQGLLIDALEVVVDHALMYFRHGRISKLHNLALDLFDLDVDRELRDQYPHVGRALLQIQDAILMTQNLTAQMLLEFRHFLHRCESSNEEFYASDSLPPI